MLPDSSSLCEECGLPDYSAHPNCHINYNNYCVSTISNEDTNEYALKLIEGAGLSMSACREIAVSYINTLDKWLYMYMITNGSEEMGSKLHVHVG